MSEKKLPSVSCCQCSAVPRMAMIGNHMCDLNKISEAFAKRRCDQFGWDASGYDLIIVINEKKMIVQSYETEDEANEGVRAFFVEHYQKC